MKASLSTLLAVLLALPVVAAAQTLSNLSAEHEATQGQNSFTIKGADIPAGGQYQLKLEPEAGAAVTLNATRADAGTLTVNLAAVPPGRYRLSVLSGATASVVGPLTVYAADDPQISKEPALPEITRGQQLVIQGKNFAPGNYSVYLTAGGNPQNGIQLPATAAADKQSLTFTVPTDKVPVARYLVWVSAGSKFYPVPGDLRLLADTQAPATIDAISPITVYPTETSSFDFEISGKNLGVPASNNLLIVVGRGLVATGTAAECAAARASGKYDKPCLEVEPGMETRKLRVLGFQRARYDGPISIEVQVGNNVSNALPLTFSRVPEKVVFWGALAVFLAIMGIVVGLAWKGLGQSTIGRKSYSPWYAFFLDRETNTYSLSKFQLLVWMSVFVFGYLYLFLCRILIQWRFDLPPVPDNLPQMLAISAGTVVAAAGATETRGSKGAGRVHPSAADFVTTGGLVAGERFQFFVWTLVGAFGFLSIVLLTDPSKLVELPKIPDSFLYVMGISSVGYLAGKVTRKPGPVIRSQVVANIGPTQALPQAQAGAGQAAPIAPGQTQMTIKLAGDNMSDTATIKVDDKELRLNDQYTLNGTKRQDQAPDPSFCNELDLVLRDALPYLEGLHMLCLTNRDGQMASATFPIDPMQIDSAASNADRTVYTVSGKNFCGAITAQWKPGQGNAVDAQQVAWNSAEPGKLTVTFAAAQNPPGTLVLKSPIGLLATHKMA